MTGKTTLLLIDDHTLVARSLRGYLESFEDFAVVGVVPNGERALELLKTRTPDVAVVDLLMPGGLDGIETTRRIRRQAPAVKVLALTASVDEGRMMGVLRAGAMGYVRKDAEPETLVAAIRAVARGRTYIDPSVASLVRQAAAQTDTLTDRETDVLRHLARGSSNKDIADALGIGDETVKTHVANVLSKLQVENRAQAIVQALRLGLVTLEELD
jgi:NarL family two-component system response regulator LiaR